MNSVNNRRVRARSGFRPLLAAASFGLLFAACDPDSVLDVPTPDIVPGDIAADPDNLIGLRNGVFFEFARAYTGPAGSNAIPGIIGTSGVFTDEMWYSSTFPTMREIDARDINVENGALLTVYQYLQRARNWAEVAQEQYAGSDLAGSADHALMANLAGYTYIFFAENFCSGVPFGRAALDASLTYGEGRTTTEMYNLAIQRFDQALALGQALGTAAGTAQVNLARVGKARALLGLGDRAQAATYAAAVSSGFSRMVNYSPNASGQNNGIWGQINSSRRSSLASREGANGVAFFDRDGTTAATITIDPRVPVPSRSVGIGTAIPVFRSGKHLGPPREEMSAPAPLASWVEAQLIIAENELAGGQSNAYLVRLNNLRANVATLLPQVGITNPNAVLLPLVDPITPSARVEQFFTERAFWLHQQATRLGDLRRMMRQYGFAHGDVFPVGTTIFGRPYGTDVNMPIPFQEGNNPVAAGVCFDRLP
jgi:starch-binding outer membrane protein, SusD/RagB family